MKEQVWMYYDEVTDAVQTLVTMAEVGGLSIAYINSLRTVLQSCKKSRFVQVFFNGVRKQCLDLLRLFVDFIPDSED